jgi:hypothetical protein
VKVGIALNMFVIAQNEWPVAAVDDMRLFADRGLPVLRRDPGRSFDRRPGRDVRHPFAARGRDLRAVLVDESKRDAVLRRAPLNGGLAHGADS